MVAGHEPDPGGAPASGLRPRDAVPVPGRHPHAGGLRHDQSGRRGDLPLVQRRAPHVGPVPARRPAARRPYHVGARQPLHVRRHRGPVLPVGAGERKGGCSARAATAVSGKR